MQNGIDKILNQSQLPPLPIRISDMYRFGINPQIIINDFFEKYINKKESYSLERVLWFLIYSRSQHPLTKIQSLSTAFDLLCNCFFRGKANIVVDKKIFNEALTEINKILDRYIKDERIRKYLKNRAVNINNNSINQRNKNIFQELGMELSSLESAAIRSRNTSVHGSLGNIDYIKIIKEANAYTVLLNRLLLKLIGLEFYVDYSVQGHLINNVSNPQLGEYNVFKN